MSLSDDLHFISSMAKIKVLPERMIKEQLLDLIIKSNNAEIKELEKQIAIATAQKNILTPKEAK